MTPSGKTVVIGFGSIALKDDGLPVHLIRKLATNPRFKQLTFLTSAVGGLELITLIGGYSTAVLLDTLKTGKGKPGEVKHFIYPQFGETFHLSSQHDASFEQAIELGKKLGIKLPARIHIVAMEIEDNLTLGEDMSPSILGQFDTLLNLVEIILRDVSGRREAGGGLSRGTQ